MVVNADDFGLSEAINSGIESTFTRGILRSASLMPNGRAFHDAVRIAAALPGLGVGIHLSLIDEQCSARSTEIRGLADVEERLPRHYRAFLFSWLMRKFSLQQIRIEVRSQILRVLEAGIQPTHLDSHQHLHLFPPILDIVLEETARAGIRVIRLPADCSPGRGIKGEILARFSRRAMPRMRASGIRFADHFWGMACSGCMNEKNLLSILAGLKSGINELMCHPGFSDTATRERYPWRYHWDEEASALTSPSIPAFIESQNIRLASFRDAWEPNPPRG